MSTHSGCHYARNMITIEEAACPQCNSPIEFFIRDGMQIADAICENCGFTIEGYTTENNAAPCVKRKITSSLS